MVFRLLLMLNILWNAITFGFLLFAVTLAAEEAGKMGSMVDEINAYSYAYPLELPSEKLVFKWYCYVYHENKLNHLIK